MCRRKTSAVVDPLSRTRVRLNSGQVGFFMRTSTGRRVVMLDGFSDRAIFFTCYRSENVSRSVWRPVRHVNSVAGAAVDRPRGQLTTSVGRRLDGVSVRP